MKPFSFSFTKFAHSIFSMCHSLFSIFNTYWLMNWKWWNSSTISVLIRQRKKIFSITSDILCMQHAVFVYVNFEAIMTIQIRQFGHQFSPSLSLSQALSIKIITPKSNLVAFNAYFRQCLGWCEYLTQVFLFHDYNGSTYVRPKWWMYS